MPSSVANARLSKEVRTLDAVRLSPAKAHLESPTASNPVHDGLLDRLARTVESSLTDAHGSQKAAALTLEVDQSQMKRQLRIGTFDLRQQAAAGEAFLARLGEALVEEFGSARKTRKQLAIERLPELLSLMLDAVTEED